MADLDQVKNPITIDDDEIQLSDQPEGPTTVADAGETLAGVSMRCEVSVHELCRWNQIRRDEGLRAGQVLRLSSLSQHERDAIPHTNWIDTGTSVGKGHRRSGGGKYAGNRSGFGGLGGAGGGGAVRTGVVVAAASQGGGACTAS